MIFHLDHINEEQYEFDFFGEEDINTKKTIPTGTKSKMTMTEKQTSITDKIDSITKELRMIISKNPKNNTKINELLAKLRSIGTWHIIDPLKRILETRNCSLRIQQKILELFGKIQDPRVISILASYLEHDDARIRNTAFKSLSLIKNPKVTQYLISAIKDDKGDKWIKIFAIYGLTKNASPKVIQPIIDLLGDSEEEVRKEAIISLSKLKIENIDDLLIANLDSKDRFVKLGVVNLIGERIVTKSVERLIGLLGNEDLRLNLLICNTLSKLSAPKSLIPLLDHSIKEGNLSNRYLLCIQKMDESIVSPLIDIYLKDATTVYGESIEYLLSKTGLHTHELLLDRKSNETNPDLAKKLDLLEKRIEK